MFKKTKICTGVLIALGGTLALSSLPVLAQSGDRVEITGSRIKRVDAEGALPITTINREEIAASGATTVAEFVRMVPFASTGNFRPQSGSSAQSLAEVNLRGLGAERTLVLIDGRRAAKGPMIGDRVDVNIIPMAMIERVEVLTDSGSSIYGSDAIGGVMNFITRKDFQGIELMAGTSRPRVEGGDREEAHAIVGVTGEKGRVLGGISVTSRDIVFSRQRPWTVTRGASVYGNNYTTNDAAGNDRFNFTAVPGGCTETNFYMVGASCRYDFTKVAADEAQVKNMSVFMRGDYQISADWTGYLGASISRVDSFGRYAPTPGYVPIDIDSPNNPLRGQEAVNLWHRFAAAGTRDNLTDNSYYNLNLGAQGSFRGIDIDVGVRRSDSQYYELGKNYIVRPLAQQAFNDGTYDVINPSQNDPAVLNGIKAVITRDARFKDEEFYVNGTVGLFKMGGGTAQLNVGGEYRKETFADLYDSLQEAGVIEGSAGNSSGGSRNIKAMFGEMLLPITSTLETSLSARYERYSDYGSDFSPKIGVKWKPISTLAFRASAGKGFRAPSLPILTQKTTFSAESVVDNVSCLVLNPGEDDCQVNTYTIANPSLDSEKSTQFSIGALWEATNWLSFKADYWNVKIDDVIKGIGAQDLVDRSVGTDPRPIPPGLSVSRNAGGVITRIDAGYANEGTLKTDGIDFTVTGNFPLGGMGRVRSELRWTHVLSYKDGDFDFNGSIGQPQDRAMWVNNWNFGDLTLQWNVNYLGRNEFQPNSTDARSVGSYTTHDLQVSWKTPIKGGTLVAGIVNVGDKLPTRINFDGREFNFNLYDAYGRTPYIRYTQRF
ncbi:MAG: TonB-dependent receptor [Rubrivivax sp.]|nr:TonB-dependent receptor [Rubrivivax sp.]